jgi:hypothetical protein
MVRAVGRGEIRMSYPLRALPSTTYTEDIDLPVLVALGLLIFGVIGAVIYRLWRRGKGRGPCLRTTETRQAPTMAPNVRNLPAREIPPRRRHRRRRPRPAGPVGASA